MQDVNNPALRHGLCFDLGFGGIGLVATYIRKRTRVSRGSEKAKQNWMENVGEWSKSKTNKSSELGWKLQPQTRILVYFSHELDQSTDLRSYKLDLSRVDYGTLLSLWLTIYDCHYGGLYMITDIVDYSWLWSIMVDYSIRHHGWLFDYTSHDNHVKSPWLWNYRLWPFLFMNYIFLLLPLIGIEMLRLLSEDGSIHTGNIGTYMSRPICDSYIEHSSFSLVSLIGQSTSATEGKLGPR